MDDGLNRVAGDVLVVDDDPVIISLLVDLLTEEGYSVRSAADGLEGWLAIVEAPPAILLTDIRMPVMSGAELARRVRAAGYVFPIVIIAATAELAEPLLHLDRTTYLDKPFALDALLECVAQYAAGGMGGSGRQIGRQRGTAQITR
jgi:CheY-like chemotaxis protein